jgi:hypothetical protein
MKGLHLALALALMGGNAAYSQAINVGGATSTMTSQCNQNAARKCESRVNECYEFCGHALVARRAASVHACQQGCLHRHNKCKQEAGCR